MFKHTCEFIPELTITHGRTGSIAFSEESCLGDWVVVDMSRSAISHEHLGSAVLEI